MEDSIAKIAVRNKKKCPEDEDTFVSVSQVMAQKKKPVSYQERFWGKGKGAKCEEHDPSRTVSLTRSESAELGTPTQSHSHWDEDDDEDDEGDGDVEPGDWAEGLPTEDHRASPSSSKGTDDAKKGESSSPSLGSASSGFAGENAVPPATATAPPKPCLTLSPASAIMLEEILVDILAAGPLLLAKLGSHLPKALRDEVKACGGLKAFLKSKPATFAIDDAATKETVYLIGRAERPLSMGPGLPATRTPLRPAIPLPVFVVALTVEATGMRVGTDQLVAIKVGVASLGEDHVIREVEARSFPIRSWYPAVVLPSGDVVLNEVNPEAEVLLSFYEYYQQLCLDYPGFHLVCPTPGFDIPLIDFTLAALLGKPPLCLRPGVGAIAQPLSFPVDFTAFVCGLASVAPAGPWLPLEPSTADAWGLAPSLAVAKQYIRKHQGFLARRGLEAVPGCLNGPLDALTDTRVLAWQYLRCLSILRMKFDGSLLRDNWKGAMRSDC